MMGLFGLLEASVGSFQHPFVRPPGVVKLLPELKGFAHNSMGIIGIAVSIIIGVYI